MNTVNTMIEEYLASKRLAWSETTLRSERHRLASVASVLDGNPATLWESIQNRAPYTRLTIWTRVCDLWQWALDKRYVESNPYRSFRRENARVFKHVYETHKPDLSFDEARTRINGIADRSVRSAATALLMSGLRASELSTLSDGRVRGKGNKVRRAFAEATPVPYHTLRRALAKVGLKPHDLRKLFLTRIVESGANPFELCEIAGWASIQTAQSYIKVNSDRLERLVETAQGGANVVTKVQVPGVLPDES